jgi:hypothetical protein
MPPRTRQGAVRATYVTRNSEPVPGIPQAWGSSKVSQDPSRSSCTGPSQAAPHRLC